MVLQQLMIYIVALTIIMQNVFAVTTSTNNNVVTGRLIDLAIQTFLRSSQREIVPSIKEFMGRTGNLVRGAVLLKITELIKSNHISPDDLAEIKRQLRNFEADDR
jgi:predicted oxidoreductase